MAYKAYLNNQLFFDSSLQDESFFLSYAVLELTANTAGDFTFRIPPSNDYYDSFHRLTDYVDVYRDDDLIFSGRVYSITEETDTQRLISCEGLLALLNDSIYRPYTFEGTLRNLVRNILDSHNSQVEADKQITAGILTIEDADVYRAYQNYETSISRLKDLVASFGGYISVTKQNSALNLNWTPDFTEGCDQVVMLNSNLIRITKEENSDGIITVLVPVGATKDDGSLTTIASVNSGLDYIVASQEYLDQYGYVVGTHRWQDVNVPQILKTKAQKYLTASLQPRTTIELTAADLADAGYDLDAFRVGQKVTVKSDPHGIDYVQFNCQEQRLDLLRPESNFLTLGEVKEGYVQVNSRNSLDSIVTELSSQFASRSMLQLAIQSATQLITGNSGGYVVLHDSDNDTYPDEILIMDTPDISTAVKVWRWNNSGLGYSSTGYNGTYGLAMTMDGQIVADFITTGTLNADRIRAGVIRGQQGNTYWDLNTGVLHIEGSGDIDKSKTFIYQPVPPYYVGDLWCTQRSETSGVVGYAIAGYAIVGDESDGEGGKIMACIYTRTSGSFNPDDWTLITNYIDDSDLQILQQRISSAEINISANTAEIQTKASVEIVDNLGNRLASAETTIEQNSHDITLKATESDITGNYVIGKINLNSTTATIAASHIDLQGAVSIMSLDQNAQSRVVTSTTSKIQYYLSTSSSSATGGSWSDTVPTWSSGKYVWTRVATTRTFVDSSTSTTYSTAVYDNNMTTACRKSNSADATIADWCYNNNITYIDGGHLYTGTVTAAKIAANAITADKINAGAVTAGKLAANAVTADSINTGAVVAAKIAAGAITTDKLAANAVTAAKIDVANLFSQNITATNFHITGGSIGVTTSASDTHYISLSHGIYTSWFAPEQIWFGEYSGSTIVTEVSYMAGGVYMRGEYNNKLTDGYLHIFGSAAGSDAGKSRCLANYLVYYDGCFQYSDRRIKDNIVELQTSKAEEFIYNLKPVSYEYIKDLGATYHGFVAQDVEKIRYDDRWKIVSEQDDMKALEYSGILADLVATVQAQNERIKTLERRL